MSTASTVQQSATSAPSSAQDLETIKKYASKLPLGWPGDAENWRMGWGVTPLISMKIFGILFTALMVSLGTNFWFELLNKFVNMRSAGKKPPTKEEQEAQKKGA